MKNIVVMPNSYKDPGYRYSRQVISYLEQHGAHIFLSASLRNEISVDSIEYYDGKIPREAEMILVIGGDGSVLDAATCATKANVPLLGINLGRLGYLAELEAGEIDMLEHLLSDNFTLREHMTLEVSLIRNGKKIRLTRKAVNDVVVSQEGGDGMSEILLEDGVGNHLAYLADGMIVATPLGSTAYSLAAGGPVIDASLSALCVTPICAHSLFSRSVLFPPQYTITITNNSRREGQMRVTVDGGKSYVLSPGDCVEVKKSRRPLRMITLKKQTALGVLCRKMQLLNPRH